MSDLIPAHYRLLLAEAANNGKLCLTLVIAEESVEELRQGRTTAMQLDNGAAIVIVPEAAARRAYEAEEEE